MNALKFFALSLCAAAVASAQPNESRKVELSLSASFQSISMDEERESSDAFLLLPRVGVFLFEGLEIEPEILFLSRSGATPLYVLNGNISYNFLGLEKTVPFLLAGYGVANSLPYFDVPYTLTPSTVGVLNLGGGLKLFVRENIAVRLEYRYQRYQGEVERDSYWLVYPNHFEFIERVDVRMHTGQLGLSVLF